MRASSGVSHRAERVSSRHSSAARGVAKTGRTEAARRTNGTGAVAVALDLIASFRRFSPSD